MTTTPIQARGLPDPNPFALGWRYEQEVGPDGATTLKRVPLTAEDLLHPREGDHIIERTLQAKDRTYLFNVFRTKTRDMSGLLVLTDCLINWGISDLPDHGADIAVFRNLRNKDQEWTTFHVASEAARPVVIVEIVSPNVRANDVEKKVKEYYKAGVPLYVIVDQESENGPRWLLGYQSGPNGYVPVPLDRDGRLLLQPLGLSLGLVEDRLICVDAQTGKQIEDFSGQYEARLAAEQATAEAQQTAAEAQRARLAEVEARLLEQEARLVAENALAESRVRIAELEAKLRQQQEE